MRIYWANSLFTEAQRDFNLKWANRMRQAGHSVILPQELSSNTPGYSPSAGEIFLGDTATLLTCDALVAVIDDETIDSGVATEIGIAYAHGVPIFPVYTDIRQHRQSGAMYKNLYPLGAVYHPTGVATTIEELLRNAEAYDAAVVDVTVRGNCEDYRDHLSVLEKAYDPRWAITYELDRLSPNWRERTIVDFGCGSGVTLTHLRAAAFVGQYWGFDIDGAALAYARQGHSDSRFFDDLGDLVRVVGAMNRPPLVMANFVLHDMRERRPLEQLVAAAPIGSEVLICDLEIGDLPNLTRLVEAATGRAYRPSLDRRLSASRAGALADSLMLEEVRLAGRKLRVELDPVDVLRHADLFGILDGLDLGVPSAADRELSVATLRRLVADSGRHQDDRHFIVMYGRRVS